MATGKAAAVTSDAMRPFSRMVVVVKSDVTILPVTRGLYVGVAGDVGVTMADGTTGVLKAVPVGFHWLQIQQVLSTGTAATDMWAMY